MTHQPSDPPADLPEVPPPPAPDRPPGRGLGHVAFAVVSLAAVLAMVACAGHTGL